MFSESTQVVKIAAFNFLHERGIKDFDKENYHLHVPMGATPKDGPSAGVSIFTALVSSALNKPPAADLAMTGELTTLGEVIQIGGVREKLTAVKSHRISRVILPYANKKNVKPLPSEFKKGFTIYYVRNAEQLYEIAFPREEFANLDAGVKEAKTDRARKTAEKAKKKKTDAFHKHLLSVGVVIDEFEEDTYYTETIENEPIVQKNDLE